MRKIIYLALCCTLALPGAVAFAQTPDGLTPAVEQDCDALVGAAFGLCNAYCEAMDCELGRDDDPLTEPHATDQACERVLANFQKAVGDTTASPPCAAQVQCGDDCGGGNPQCAEAGASCSVPDEGPVVIGTCRTEGETTTCVENDTNVGGD